MITIIEWLIPDHGRVTRSVVTLIGCCFAVGAVWGFLAPLVGEDTLVDLGD